MRPASISQPIGSRVADSHVGPALSPSNVTVPIITITIATMPGSGVIRARPESGRRSPTWRPRTSTTDNFENRLK